jgi:phosphonate ABC transporter permease subunit PhnE
MSEQPTLTKDEQANKDALAKETRNSLQRLLIVLAIAAGILVYSYGWTVTEIDLDEPQEEQRQTNVTRALRELLSPRIFEQERTVVEVDAPFLMACETDDAPDAAVFEAGGGAVAIIEPTCAESGDVITVRLVGADVGLDGRLRWIPPADEASEEAPRARPLTILETEREDFVTDTNGELTATIEVPRIRGGEGEIHTLRVLLAEPSGPIEFSETAEIVIDRMVQTIFIALVATTVAIPIAAMISFFAAQNLMKRVRLSVGSLLMAFLLFSVGVVIGGSFVSEIVQWGIEVGRGALSPDFGALLAFIIPGVVIFATLFVLAQLAQREDMKPKNALTLNRLRQVASSIITALVILFLLGSLGGLGLLGGEQIMILGDSLRPAEVSDFMTGVNNVLGSLIWSLGNLLMILGSLIELFKPIIAGVVFGFTLAGLGASILGNGLRRLRGSISHVLGAILGAMTGAILLAVVSAFALSAALLGILPPLIAGIIGGSIGQQVYHRFTPKREAYQGKTRITRLMELGLFIAGFFAMFIFVFNLLGIGRSLVDGTLPPQTPAIFLGMELPLTVYMFRAALVGAVLAGISSGLAGLHGVFPLGRMLYNTSRTSLNIIRSIEPLIMGLVFVIWVGIGPFAGVLALTLHSIAALGKLYSEQIENIDPGPLEALESTGANQLQTIIYAVVPQIIPPYIAFTMYRWDINVRMSTIIGFVGGGGIGLLLQQQINLLRYRDAGVAVLAIAIVVSILDYASASIRERLT